MECRECCSNIQPFLKNKLDYKETRLLIKHVSSCQKCEDELKTQYLISEGLNRLENGGDFNLISDYADMFEDQLIKNEKVFKSRVFINLVAGVIFIFTILTLVFSLI